jgi:hypothetical protein
MAVAHAAHTGTVRDAPPWGAQATSVVDGPCRGSKKHGGRRSGRGLTGQTRLRAFHREAGILELLAQALEVLERAGGTEAAVCRVIAEDGALVVVLGPRIGPGHLGVDVEGAKDPRWQSV